MFYHGADGDHTAPTANPLLATTTAGLLNTNYAIASLSTPLNWGNDLSVTRYNLFYDHLDSEYTVTKMVAYGHSMGALPSLTGIIDGHIPFTHWAGIYPVCDLADAYTNPSFTALINAAYGINGTPYATATAGNDPILEAAAPFNGIKMRYYASADDDEVPKAAHSDAFATHVAGQAVGNVVVACWGDHGHNSHFRPVDLLAFYEA